MTALSPSHACELLPVCVEPVVGERLLSVPVTRNPWAGIPFDTSDDEIAEALLDVSIPTLMMSLVHITGDAD